MVKLWEIIKLISEGKMSKGVQFIATDTPISLILEYDGNDLVYANIMGDITSRKTVTLCSGEINTDYDFIVDYEDIT